MANLNPAVETNNNNNNNSSSNSAQIRDGLNNSDELSRSRDKDRCEIVVGGGEGEGGGEAAEAKEESEENKMMLVDTYSGEDCRLLHDRITTPPPTPTVWRSGSTDDPETKKFGIGANTDVFRNVPSPKGRGRVSVTDSMPVSSLPLSPSTRNGGGGSGGGVRDTNELLELLSGRPDVVEKYIMEIADADHIQRLLALKNRSGSGDSESQSNLTEDLASRTKRTTSVTSDLFNNWLASSPIKRAKSPSGPCVSGDWRRHLGSLDEGELFMELIKDVSNELDLDVLCHKILVNVSLLTHADRGSLFLARGLPENRYLTAKLFDVTVNTSKILLPL